MGRTKPCLFIILLTIILQLSSTIAMNPKGFTLRMIRRDSKESPFFNRLDDLITPEERYQTLIDQSRARARYIASQINPDIVVPVVYDDASFYYAAHVRIGTFPEIQPPFMDYYFLIDSSSDLTWLQCEGAEQFFKQDSPLYPWKNSTSYIPGNCQELSSCDHCDGGGKCLYTVSYGSSQVTSGVIATENFTFSGGYETIPLLMGCGLRQENFTMGDNVSKGKPDLIAGILGLGRGIRSIVGQLGARGGKFSYCLEKFSGGNSYLTVGEDATIKGQVLTTPLVRTSFETSYYYLNLVGISVGGDLVKSIQRIEFGINHDDNSGGCIIDSGAPWTTMYSVIFNKVAESVEDYFLKNNGMRRAGFTANWICFIPIPGKEYTKPNITFHFQQADYVASETWFEREGNICLAMVSSESKTPAVILGAFQQVNKRILYDNMDLLLSFVDETC